MRFDWVPLSASALVIGAMALVFGSVVNPVANASTAETLRSASSDSAAWLAMAVMFSLTSVGLTVGLPAVLLLLPSSGRRIGLAGVLLLAVGAVGTYGYAMLLVFFRALAVNDVVTASELDRVTEDQGLSLFLSGWVGSFYGGVALLAVALWLAGTTPRWVPVALAVFVLVVPLLDELGRWATAGQTMLLAAALTGVATEAVTRARPAARHPVSVG